MFLVALGEHELLIGFKHRELADFLQVSIEAPFGGEDRKIGLGHESTPFFPPRAGGPTVLRVRPARGLVVLDI